MQVMQPSLPDPLDQALGTYIRVRRKRLGISQSKLAESVGVTFQQVQKYERGFNRVSFSALVKIAKALDCRVSDLIEEIDGPASDVEDPHSAANLLKQPGAAQLLESYGRIRSKTVRQAILDLSQKMSLLP
jgi:transcriptional regulator with XRE-family HTH domain